MTVTDILQPECIKVPLASVDKPSALAELTTLLDSSGRLLNATKALDAVMLREKIRSTGIGSGMAIPHGKCDAVKQLVMALGIAHKPIDFQSIDGKPVYIIMMLISPADQTGPHIQALATISRMMLDDQLTDSLKSATSAEQIYKLLREKEGAA